ncbi:AAC-rich mRNA clone AAC4 protein-like isoform X2 [Acanthaster planci]|nr:AAC-rich mRNA clone AAC4 protein-like isoform X2 [Acanthaster planci]
MDLSESGQKIRSIPNAGGNSVDSEVLSFELMHRCFGAQLLKTEMEVVYYPEGGSITDYTCLMFGTRLGVSVTRAMKFKGEFELEDAEKLLQKKLSGVVNSSRNSLECWSKQILHIWATNHSVANQMARAYSRMPRDLTTNTVVLVTVVTTNADRAIIFG